MVGSLLEDFEHYIDDLKLIPSTGGVYEVTVDGDLIYSKKETGRHTEYDEVAASIKERV